MIPTRQIGSSILLFLVGFFVLFLSLHTAHAAQMTPEEEMHTDFHWFDKNMPGTPHYLVYRAIERAQLLQSEVFAPSKEVSAEYLLRASQRVEASSYAWSDKEEQRALTTLYKAFGYVHRAIHECRETWGDDKESCKEIIAQAEPVLTHIETQASLLQQQAKNDRVRSEAATLAAHTDSFRSTFLNQLPGDR